MSYTSSPQKTPPPTNHSNAEAGTAAGMNCCPHRPHRPHAEPFTSEESARPSRPRIPLSPCFHGHHKVFAKSHLALALAPHHEPRGGSRPPSA